MEDSFEKVERAWDQQPEEPEIWYHIFRDYYLPLGEQRSLRNAFEFFIRVEKPKQYKELDPDNITTIPSHWNEFALRFEWGKRAMEWDQAKLPDISQLYVKQVLQYLQSNAMKAADALVSALNNERTRVQAANSILNRSGVPEVSEVNVRTGVSFTSDDLAAASSKLDEWKNKKLNG